MNPTDQHPAVVLGLGINGLGIVRTLGRRNIPVIGVYADDKEVGARSRYCTPLRLADVRTQQAQFLSQLLELGRTAPARPVLFPTNDSYLAFIAEHYATLQQVFLFRMPGAALLTRLISKRYTEELLRQVGVDRPRTFVFDSRDALARQIDALPYPCVIKPDFSPDAELLTGGKVWIAENRQSLERYLGQRPDLMARIVVQEVVPGRDGDHVFCCVYMNERHDVIAAFTGRKNRQYPPDFGVASSCRSETMPDLLERTASLLRRLGHVGLAEVEYKRDLRDGGYKLLEINARSWSQNLLGPACGVDLIHAAYLDATSSAPPSVSAGRQKDDVIWLHVLHEFYSFFRLWRHKRLNLIPWLRSLGGDKTVYACWSPHDIRPFLSELRQHMRINRFRGRIDAAPSAERKRPLTVLHLVSRLAPAGLDGGVIRLVNHLNPGKFAPLIGTMLPPKPAVRSMVTQGEVILLDRRPGIDVRAIWSLSRMLRRHRVDILHTHNWGTYLYGVLAAKLAGVPIVVHGEHGLEAHELAGLGRKRRWACHALAPLTTAFTVVSYHLRRRLAETWGIREQRVHVMPNGVDLERFHPLDGPERARQRREVLGLGDHDVALVTVASFRAVKNIPAVLRLMPSLVQAKPGLRYFLIGDGPQFQELADLVKALDLEDAVRFLGVRLDVHALLPLCDIYMLPSLFEGMSNTILEAMASGLPVIASDIDGNRELMIDGVTGMLVPMHEPQALASALLELCQDGERRRALGDNGRQRVEKEFALAQMVGLYETLYDELAAKRLRR